MHETDICGSMIEAHANFWGPDNRVFTAITLQTGDGTQVYVLVFSSVLFGSIDATNVVVAPA